MSSRKHIQEFVKISTSKDMSILLKDESELLDQYNLLKGKEKRNIQVQLDYIKRLNKRILKL